MLSGTSLINLAKAKELEPLEPPVLLLAVEDHVFHLGVSLEKV